MTNDVYLNKKTYKCTCRQLTLNKKYSTGNVKPLRSKRTVADCTSLVAGHSLSVLDWCVSVFSLCGLCLFIVDSTVER